MPTLIGGFSDSEMYVFGTNNFEFLSLIGSYCLFGFDIAAMSIVLKLFTVVPTYCIPRSLEIENKSLSRFQFKKLKSNFTTFLIWYQSERIWHTDSFFIGFPWIREVICHFPPFLDIFNFTSRWPWAVACGMYKNIGIWKQNYTFYNEEIV